jgi:hypothetical protein
MFALCIVLVAVTIVLALYCWTDTFSPGYISPATGIPTLLDGPWTGYTVHLFQNNIVFSYSTLIGGLTECTFPGYAAVTPGSAVPGATVGKTTPIVVSNAVFTRSTTGVSQTAYGYYVLDGAGNLIGGGTFPAPGPFAFTTAGDALTVSITENVTVVP